MNEYQNKILSALTQIVDKIKNSAGKIPLSAFPVMDLRRILANRFTYGADENPLAEKISKDWGDILFYLASRGNAELFVKLVYLATDSMRLWSELETYCSHQLANTQLAYGETKLDEYLYDEIIKTYAHGQLDEAFIARKNYRSLASVLKKNEIELFRSISRKVYQTNIERIKKLKKVKVAFFLHQSQIWSCEMLYKMLAGNPEFDVFIAVAPLCIGAESYIGNSYEPCLNYFKSKNYAVTGMFDFSDNRYLSWEEIGMPDIIFVLYPHSKSFRDSANIENFPLSALNVYIPYGVYTTGTTDISFNLLSHKLCWKIFCESQAHKKMAAKYSDIQDDNVVCSGYVKMDEFYLERTVESSRIWKIKNGLIGEKVKKIIYAPHHTIGESLAAIKFGNFDKIYMDIYEYAKQHDETTSWIFRPHPYLRSASVALKLFENESQYDDYLNMWNELPNAKVIESGTYKDMFLSSDSMILDSVSFMSEYLYVHKPLLFLTREEQTFHNYGEELMNVLYLADGGDFPAIADFIEDVVISGKDPMKNKREEFFEKHLNYLKYNGKLASDFIYDYLMDAMRNP